MQNSLPPAGPRISNKKNPSKYKLRKFLKFKLRLLIIVAGLVLILSGGVLWILSVAFLKETWSSILAASFVVLGALISYAQYLIPQSPPNVSEEQLFEIYRQQVTSQLIGEFGAVLIRTRDSMIYPKEGGAGKSIAAIKLTGDALKHLTFSNMQEDIQKALAYCKIIVEPTRNRDDRLDEVITPFRNLKPGLYLFFPFTRISAYYIDEEDEEDERDGLHPLALYTPILVKSGETGVIDWRHVE